MAENQAQTAIPTNPTNTPSLSQRYHDINEFYHAKGPEDITPPSAHEPTYLELADKETEFMRTVNVQYFAIATIGFLHIAFGTILTILGASSSPHKITTIFGVLNTVTAAVPVVLRRQGLGPKASNFREGCSKMQEIRNFYEETERMNASAYADPGKRRVYKQAVDTETYFKRRYRAFLFFEYLQIAVGLTATALAATSSPPVVITVFGALNTVATGIPTLTRGQVLPYRLRLEWQDLNKLFSDAEAREGDDEFARMHAELRAAIWEYI